MTEKVTAAHAKGLPAQSAAGPQQGAAATAPAAAAAACDLLRARASDDKRSKRGRVGEDSQTEYIVIPPKVKKRSRDLLTEHQREVAQRQRQGRLLLSCAHDCSTARGACITHTGSESNC